MAIMTTTDWAVLRLLRPLPPRPFTYLSHLWLFRRPPSFRNPRTFTEHVHAKKLFERDRLFTLTADKYAVRDYVAERVGAERLVPLLAVADDPADLDFDKLPNAFVAKASHGNNANLIVRDKAGLDWAASVKTMRRWVADNWYRYNKEWAYLNIPPRIVVEEFLDDGGRPPVDYKFFVFSGKARLIQVDTGRFSQHRRNLFDEHWRSLAVALRYPRPPAPPPRPALLPEMLAVAERLGKDFTFARVDLYQHRGRVYFGEITHYPGGGSEDFDPLEFDHALGEVWRSGRAIPERFYDSPRE
ncbi:MAG TPA: ATP-grasp fold amidoligase family protein [Pyrinomonadaceae bacterium]|nr:ATP-grasp fold amidoligase family protein [Pyrinomonadaceae bacterium]